MSSGNCNCTHFEDVKYIYLSQNMTMFLQTTTGSHFMHENIYVRLCKAIPTHVGSTCRP